MKVISMSLCLFLSMVYYTACSQTAPKRNATQAKSQAEFRDSIINKYVKGIGQYYSFNSGGWESMLDTALKYLPHDGYLFQLKAMAYFKQQKYQVGSPYLDSAVKYDADRYIDYRAFMKCIFQRDYIEAIKDFNTSKQLKGENGVVMDHSYNFYIGISNLQLNKFHVAQQYLEKDNNYIVRSKGAEWVPYLTPFYLGVSHYEQKEFDSAIVYLNKAIERYPQFADAKCYKAISLYNQNHFQEALDLLAEACQNIAQGYTINDANAKYELYPYQVSKEFIQLYIDNISKVYSMHQDYEHQKKDNSEK